MALGKLGLSVREKRVKKSGSSTNSKQIDFSDISEMSSAQLKSMKRVGRPLDGLYSKLMIAIWLNPEVLKKRR